MVQCKCRTLKGVQCKRVAVINGMCTQHSKTGCGTVKPASIVARHPAKPKKKPAAKSKRKPAAKTKISSKKPSSKKIVSRKSSPKMSPKKVPGPPPEYLNYDYDFGTGSGNNKNGVCEGYWGSVNMDKTTQPFNLFGGESPQTPHNLPQPVSSKKEWKDKKAFVNLVHKIEDDKSTRKIYYKGLAFSRVEPGAFVMSNEYVDEKNKICWPGGYAEHYILKHNVMPTKKFYEYIIMRSKQLGLV
jgi:hypothetical protein